MQQNATPHANASFCQTQGKRSQSSMMNQSINPDPSHKHAWHADCIVAHYTEDIVIFQQGEKSTHTLEINLRQLKQSVNNSSGCNPARRGLRQEA